MKKRLTLAISLLAVVAIIAGGTFAWFTATADPVTNEFKAGTMELDTKEIFCPPTNVNPGDCYWKIAMFKAGGTKKAFVRAKITPEFTELPNAPEGFDPDESIIEYDIAPGWIEGNDGWYYYQYEVRPNSNWCSYTLPIIYSVCFDGEGMDDNYQGAKATVKIESESVQSSNGAWHHVWGNPFGNSNARTSAEPEYPVGNLTEAELEAKIQEALETEIEEQ